MQMLLFAGLTLFFFTLGYYSGTSQSSTPTDPESQLQAALGRRDDGKNSPAQSLSYSLAVVAEEERHARHIHEGEPSIVEQALEQAPKTPQEEKLAQALGDAPLNKAFLAFSHQDDIPGAQLYSQRFLDHLLRNGDSGFSELKSGLNRLPADQFPIERAAILMRAEQIPGKGPEVKDLAYREVLQNTPEARPDPSKAQSENELNLALSTTPAILLPIAAHSVFLRNAEPSEALDGTLQGILTQKDIGIRSSLANQLITLHPQLLGPLKTGLEEHHIDLPALQTYPENPSN